MSRSMPTRVDLASSRASAPVPHGPRGFTLAEVVLSLAIMSILMTGLVSAVMIASQALPSEENPAQAASEAAVAADLLAEELQQALWIRERTATSVEFAVSDRDADGAAERVRYAWSGVPGAPLTRQYNGGAVVEVLQDVQEFSLGYELKAVTEEYPGVPPVSTEILLRSYDSLNELYEGHVHDVIWWSQYFEPILPEGAVSWSVTRVKFMAKRDHGDDTTTRVQLRLPNADGTPSDTVVEEVSMPQLLLTDDYQWVEKSFVNASGLSASQGICLAFITYDKNSAKLWIEDKGVVLPNAGLSKGGVAWNPIDSTKALRFYVYGRAFLPNLPQTATRQYVMSVQISLRTSKSATAGVLTTAQTLNTPELLSGWWQADFGSDPTLDHNGDGKADWIVREEKAFDLGSLAAGVWQADVTLDTYPDNDFTRLTTAEVSFRNTSIGGDGAVFWINADWSDSTCAPIVATLQLQADNTQTLTIYAKIDEITKLKLLLISGLPTSFVKLRLLIDPDLNTVNVKVNEVCYGTFAYDPIAPFSNDRFASLFALGSTAEFDHVSVRVGE